MIKVFNSLKEIEKYYDEKTNTYIFKEDGKYIDLIKFNFDLNIKSNIECRNIIGKNITAYDIDACDIIAININASDILAFDINALNINAWDINACDIIASTIVANNISYFEKCISFFCIKCKSIKGRRPNAKHFVLDGKLSKGIKCVKNININSL